MPSRSRTPCALIAALLLAAPAHSDESATYRLDVDIAWSAATHPFEFPDGAHVTPLVGAAHDERFILFRDGFTASSGLESVAERGRTAIVRAELEEARGAGRVGVVFEGPGLDAVPGRLGIGLTATRQHPLVSFATMIAPSPDWFTGAAGIALFAEGAWVERYEAALWAWALERTRASPTPPGTRTPNPERPYASSRPRISSGRAG